MCTCNCDASDWDLTDLLAGRALSKSINMASGGCPFLWVINTFSGLTSLCACGGSKLCMCFSPAQSYIDTMKRKCERAIERLIYAGKVTRTYNSSSAEAVKFNSWVNPSNKIILEKSQALFSFCHCVFLSFSLWKNNFICSRRSL